MDAKPEIMPREPANPALNQEKDADPEVPSDTAPPIRPAPRDREIFFQRFQPHARPSLMGRFKTIRTVGVIFLVMAALGAGYFAAQHYRADQAHLQAEVVKARKVLICDAKGTARALLGEQDGQVRLELCDASGITRASISLGVDAEPRFSLFDKDQQKLKEWGWAAAAPAGAEPLAAGVVSSGSATGSKSRESLPPRYIGSKTSNKYHYPNCKWGQQIIPEKLLIFHSVQEAQDKGYIQCRACQPPLKDPPEETVKAAEIPLPQEFGKMPLPSE